MASTPKAVSFALETEEIVTQSSEESEESEESDCAEYVESLSEEEGWSTSDDDHAEMFEHLLERAHLGSPSSVSARLDPALRQSLLLFDKDILSHEREGKILWIMYM